MLFVLQVARVLPALIFNGSFIKILTTEGNNPLMLETDEIAKIRVPDFYAILTFTYRGREVSYPIIRLLERPRVQFTPFPLRVEFTIYRVLEDDDRHLIPIGHRGSGSDEYRRNNRLPYIPENTLVSYEKAYKSGSSWVELDLMITSDNKIVVTHNFKIDNTPVWNMTYDQFKARTSSPILFEELFWKLDAKINLDLDIKYPSIDEIEEQNLGTPPNLEHYMDLILDTIRRRKNRDLILSSFEPDAVAYLKRTAPDLNVFFLTEALPDKFTDSRRNSFANGIRFCIENDLQGIGTDSEVISANPVNEVAMVHGAGLQLVVYFWRANFRKTNYVDEIIKFECAGVDGVITDDIPMVRRIIGNTKYCLYSRPNKTDNLADQLQSFSLS
ncbi:Hypothetical protein NTJ_01782 [Nesidiocoris tenuis]|uniref:GP-PDE domain-containing protein n=1 Tax=Nesidiocoris tenuis TaxID=355587 RepID=A0ABN7A9H9_9HEMI|nr:Hypothetical protein NTJ_01782 [Nesidiocoris tenuis]